MRFHKDEMDRIFDFEGACMGNRISGMMKSIMVFMGFAIAGPLVIFILWLWANR